VPRPHRNVAAVSESATEPEIESYTQTVSAMESKAELLAQC